MKIGDVKVRYRSDQRGSPSPRRMDVFVWRKGQYWETVYSLPIPDNVRSNKSGFKEWKERALALWTLGL